VFHLKLSYDRVLTAPRRSVRTQSRARAFRASASDDDDTHIAFRRREFEPDWCVTPTFWNKKRAGCSSKETRLFYLTAAKIMEME